MPNLIRILLLDLIYPAVLGTMIVLLFLRVTTFGIQAMVEPTTYLGLLVAIYYSIGYVRTKVLTDIQYKIIAAILDAVNSLAIFICFFILGFSEIRLPSQGTAYTNFLILYLTLMYIFVAPVLLRFLVLNRKIDLQKRNVMCYLLILISILGIMSELEFLISVSAWLIVAAYYLIFMWYFIDLKKYGFGDDVPQ